MVSMCNGEIICLLLFTISDRFLILIIIFSSIPPAVTHRLKPYWSVFLLCCVFLLFILTHGTKNNSIAPEEAADRMEGDVSRSACAHLIYSLTCLHCTLIKCYWLSHEWGWINDWRPSAGLHVNKCVGAVGGRGCHIVCVCFCFFSS